MQIRRLGLLLFTGLVGACGGGSDTCNIDENTGCDDGKTCELVVGSDEPKCFEPFVVLGSVFNIETDAAISGAKVVALDINGAPRSSVATTDASGNFELEVPAERNEDGTLVNDDITLRVDASGFVTFPKGVRPALPIAIQGAALTDGRYELDTAQTDIGLFPQPGGTGTASITGTVEVPATRNGILVVAETGGVIPVGTSAIADLDGNYTIFNLEATTYAVNAYSRNSNYTAASATLTAGQQSTVDLSLSGEGTSTASGQLNLTQGAPPMTSVIMVVASTYDPNSGKGDAPPGLRSPDVGTAPNITGPWMITGVPAGDYVILAAFENDGGVREVSGAGGTDLVVTNIPPNTTVGSLDFKVTEAIDIVSPGASGVEVVTAATPNLSWAFDPQADHYEVRVIDALGNVVMEDTTPKSQDPESMTYTGTTALVPEMFYQLRIFSIDTGGSIRAASEDLKGVFIYRP